MAKKKSAEDESRAEGGTASSSAAAPYVVLARKYRPATFADLIGQEAMVTTLRNAFATERLAQGYMLTGVRGVGKTTTARILSRAFNYERDGIDKPTFDMPEFGRHCAEIMEGRHPDVLEMDAASNTGVDNIREIIESARYKPLLARTKVYLIDEVHMLSKGAFNALLKTLEEPPGHVKFIFATTEVRKVPVTVLSRTQRFDLRRVDAPVLVDHFKKIIANESASAEDDALALIARAAEGSVRDGLSLLDRALAMGSGNVSAPDVRDMLGLADRGRVYDLLEMLFAGSAREALVALERLHRDGAEPAQILADLAEAVHVITRAKALGAAAAGEGLARDERERAAALGGRLSVAILSRAWQILLKGIEEIAEAPNQLAAAEMVLIRLAYTADLPAPDDLIRALTRSGTALPGSKAPAKEIAAAPAVDATTAGDVEDSGDHDSDFENLDGAPDAQFDGGIGGLAAPRSFTDAIELASAQREAKLKVHLEEHVSLVRFDPAGSIELHLLPGAPRELPNELREKLNAWTGKRWMVALSPRPGQAPLGEVKRQRQAAELRAIQEHPAVAAVLQQFPEAEITDIRPLPANKTSDTGTG